MGLAYGAVEMNVPATLWTNQEQTHRRTRVLLVDGDHPVREALHRALTLENYEVTPVATGREAIRWFAEGAVDLVVLDLNLPNESGWDVLNRVTTTAPQLPVIATTMRGNGGDTAVAQRGVAIMEKPLSLPLLLSTMQRLAAETCFVGASEDRQYAKATGETESREKP